jgi:integrase
MMAGQILKRGDNKWLVRIFKGRNDHGKKQYLSKMITGPKRDAQTYLSKTLIEIREGTFIDPTPLTVGEYLDKWLESAANAKVSERTFAEYSALLKRYVLEPLGMKKLSDLRPLDIQSLYSSMLSPKLKDGEEPEEGVIYGLGVSARTVRYTHAVLSSALKQAVRWGMLYRNPAELVQLPKHSRKEMHALSAAESAKFLKAVESDRYASLFTLALVTGMRPEEYLGLKWSDVDLTKGTVTVRRALVWRTKGGGWYFTEPKTARSRRTIPLPNSTLRILVDHKRSQAMERLKTGPNWQDNGLVFTTAIGTPQNISNLTRVNFKPALERAGLPKTVRLYDLRHTCATLLLAANEHPKVVSERLGHASVTLTLDTYSHVLPTMQEAASEKLERILGNG